MIIQNSEPEAGKRFNERGPVVNYNLMATNENAEYVPYFPLYSFQEVNACKRYVVFAKKNCPQWRVAPAEHFDMALTMFPESDLAMKNIIGEPGGARIAGFCWAAYIMKTVPVRSAPCAEI